MLSAIIAAQLAKKKIRKSRFAKEVNAARDVAGEGEVSI
jgi:hypothetical protein